MASYNPFNNQNQGLNTNSSIENKGLFSKTLRVLSRWGMDFDDMIVRNQVGIGMNEDPYSQKQDSMYDFFSQKAIASVLDKKSIPYLDRSYADKRRILREYSIKDELRDMVTTICDESIIYNDEKNFCSPANISTDYSRDILDKYQEYFEKIYHRYGFADNITAWNMMKDFLIDGYLAVEIVWDDKKKNIIHFNRLRPETIVPSYEPSIGNLWIQYPEDPQLRRIFLDSQIVFISYSTQNDYSETSYIEGLIKPYNQLKILEQTRIMYNIVNATVYQKFTVPTKGIPPVKQKEQIAQMISDYSETIEFDDTMGTVSINGRKQLPYHKQLWFPDGEQGAPTFELVSPQGHQLNESDMLKWFYNILKRASKIPFQRFEKEGGGGNLITDAATMTRDEITFNSFINRLRAIYKELIVKPLKLQMCMEFPELKDDEVFLNQVDIIFNSNQLFEEWKRLSNYEKRLNIMQTFISIQGVDGQPYFHIDYLIKTVLQMTQEEIDENKAYWIKNGNAQGANQEGEPGGDPMGGGLEPGLDAAAGLGADAQPGQGIPQGTPDIGGEDTAGGGDTTTDAGGDTGEFEF